MKLSRFSVHRPVFTIMVVLIVIILGLVSLMRLPVDLMPEVTRPTISVITGYVNASPQEVEELVTRPLEQALGAVSGVQELTSTSSEGASSIRVTFPWGTDLDAASNDIRDRLDRVIGRLPDDADRPMLRKFDLASFPVVILGAASRLDPVQARQMIDDQVRYRLERLEGVAAVDIWGGLEREVHVDLDPAKVKALGLGLDEVMARIRGANITLPAGTVDQGRYEITVRTPGQYEGLEELEDTVIAVREGSPIRLGEVADIVDSWQRVRRIVRVDGEPGTRLAVMKQSGTNTVDVAKAVLAEVERINEELPQLRLTPIIDTSDYIERSITNVGSAAMYGGGLAVIVLLVFLRNLRSTVIIALAIPISIVATFGLMYFANYTLNLMTLGGLALGVGMLMDNSIVVLENIYRHRERGLGAEEAAVLGSEEVAAAITASALTTMVVFLPVVFMQGMSGLMFKQMAAVVAFSLLCSLVVALTLVPMLAAKLLRPPAPPGERETFAEKLFRWTGAGLARMEGSYQGLLGWALRHRFAVVGGSVALMLGAAALVPLIGSELMPASDEGEVRVEMEMEVGTRLALLDEQMLRIEQRVREAVPEIASVVTSVGGAGGFGGSRGVAGGNVRMSLVPQSQRSRSSDQVAADLRRQLADLPGVVVRTRSGQGLMQRLMGAGADERLAVDIRGYDLATGDQLAAAAERIIRDVPGVTDTRVSRLSGSPEETIIVDRDKAADLGLTVRQIAELLQTALSGTVAGQFRRGGDEFDIRVKLRDAERARLGDLLDLTLTNAAGQTVVLRNVVSLRPRTGPMQIERKNQERVVTVSANLAGRDLGSVLADVRRGLAELPLPRDFAILYGSEYEEQQKSFRELLVAMVMAVLLVYMVMACLYESLRDPFVVMFSVPLAGIGAVAMLFFTETTFNIQSYIGFIMLGGIAVNNAILLVDHTNLLRRRDGMELGGAIQEAGRRRLRPILMTAMTTMVGLTPLAIGSGEGGQTQAPMARAVVGGLLSATLITLVLVPVVYSVFERWSGRKQQAPQPEPLRTAPPPRRREPETVASTP